MEKTRKLKTKANDTTHRIKNDSMNSIHQAIFSACCIWANADGCILPIAALKDASPWRDAHAFRFSLSMFSNDNCLMGSESLIWF